MILRATNLAALSWIEHGFGTRHAPISQDGMATLTQIHSAVSVIASAAGCAGEGDALIASQPGVTVSVRTADCLSILLADETTRTVAAIHAGWRGSALHIAAATVARLEREFGVRPSNVYAAIGPGIGGCCYQVGAEVREKFGLAGAGLLDLARENRAQLLNAGVPPGHIDVFNLCTACHPAQLHSWRRDKDGAGRMISYIRIRSAEP